VLEGTSKVIDTLKLPAYDAEAMTPFTALTENTGFSEVGVRLVEAVVALSRDANERATLSQHMFLESQANTMKIWRALAQAQAEKMVLENFEASDTMSEALGVLAPLVPALASRIGSASPAPDNEDAELDYEAAADQMVTGLAALAAERPDLITPERISKLANLVG
jgi:hypothetical protein